MKNETVNTSTVPSLYLLPDEISEPEDSNVRPFSAKAGDTAIEVEQLEALGRSIASEGQLQPIRVRPIKDPKEGEPRFALIAGRRRRKAVMMHNLASSGEPIRLAAVLAEEDIKPVHIFRSAAHENIQRKSLSAMDFAMIIGLVRKKFKWTSVEGTKKVAEFFEVSPAQITQHEKLLKLPEDLQMKVHTGDLSRDDAFRLAAVAEKQGGEAARAVLENAERVGAAAEASQEAPTSDAPVAEAAGGKKKGGKKAGSAAKSRAIKTATREAGVSQARSKKELLEFFEGCMGPVYGYPDGAVHQFIAKLIAYAAGEIGDKTLTKYFDAMVEKAPRGTVASVKAAEEKAAKETPALTAPAKKGGKKKAAKK